MCIRDSFNIVLHLRIWLSGVVVIACNIQPSAGPEHPQNLGSALFKVVPEVIIFKGRHHVESALSIGQRRNITHEMCIRDRTCQVTYPPTSPTR